MPLLTAAEVARQLAVSKALVYAHAKGVRRPVIPCVRIGTAVRFEQSQIEQFIADCRRIGMRSGAK